MPGPEVLFAWYHPDARRNYRDPDGKVIACALMAGAFVLLTGGRFFCVRGRGSGIGASAYLRPRVETGSLLWCAHVVCLQDGMVYDVLLPGPVPEQEYLERAFANSDELLLVPLESCQASDYFLREMGLGLSPMNL